MGLIDTFRMQLEYNEAAKCWEGFAWVDDEEILHVLSTNKEYVSISLSSIAVLLYHEGEGNG